MLGNRLSKVLVVFLVVLGLLPAVANSYEWVSTTETVVYNDIEIEISKTADNFIVLYDTSSSMDEDYKDTGKKKIELEKGILKLRNAFLPNLKYNAGLYTFTPQAFASTDQVLKPFYPIQPYNKVEFDKAIEQLPTEASGTTLFQAGLSELDSILSGLKGRTVVFVFSDGDYTESAKNREKPAAIARQLASKHDVKFYVINSSSKQKESAVLQAVASINESSRVITFEQFINSPLAFVGALSVIDARIVQRSVEIEKIIGAELDNLLFAYNKTDINPDYADKLKVLADYMQGNPNSRLALSGFTDSTGPQEYNLGLSRRRAESVANYLVQNYNVSADRFDLHWYGESNPVKANDTSEGRSKNRRVEGFLYGIDE